MRIVFFGCGNLATHVSRALARDSRMEIVQVCSRTLSHARELADSLGCAAISSVEEMDMSADAYVVAVPDKVQHIYWDAITRKRADAFVVHTAGCLSIESLQQYAVNAGVLYPLQSFTRSIDVDLSDTAFLVEALDEAHYQMLEDIATAISSRCARVSSAQRRAVHVAAVFASNFTNHMLTISQQIMADHDLPQGIMTPLVRETVRKAAIISPVDAQTGPARRGDENTMQAHIDLLTNDNHIEVYRAVSKSICDLYSDSND